MTNEQKSLPWNLLSFPKHDSVKRMCRDLNLIYQAEDAMKVEEYNPAHFRWTMVDNADQSVFAFERSYGDSVLLFIYNMTPNYYEWYDVGAYTPGVYDEIFNSDKDIYGGWNQYNGLPTSTYPGGPENRPYHVTVKLGSYCALILKLRVDKPKAEEKKEEPEPEPKPEPKKPAVKKATPKKAPAKKAAKPAVKKTVKKTAKK